MQIWLPEIKRIHADPDPQPCECDVVLQGDSGPVQPLWQGKAQEEAAGSPGRVRNLLPSQVPIQYQVPTRYWYNNSHRTTTEKISFSNLYTINCCMNGDQ